MAEVAALVGLVAAIAQFVEYGTRLGERLREISSSANDLPSTFSALQVRLPAVIGILSRIQIQVDTGGFGLDEAEMLLPVIENSNSHIKALVAVVEKVTPVRAKQRGKVIAKYLTGMRSLSLDSEVQKINSHLQGNLQIISLFQTTRLTDTRCLAANMPIAPSPVICDPSEMSQMSREEAQSGQEAHTPSASTDSPMDSGMLTPSSDGVDLDDVHIMGRRLSSEELGNSPVIDQPSPSLKASDRPGSPADSAIASSATGRCSSSCSCICHRPYQLSTPSFLDRLIGHVLVNYAGQAFVKAPCSERNCRRRELSAVRITYRFPDWALQRVIHLALSSTALNTKVNFNTMRVLPESAEVFAVIAKGDVDRLRHIFKAGQASIYDVSRTNWTLIHTAFTLGRTDMCQFLISEGADLTIDAANGSNVIERAWFLAQKSSKAPGDYVMCDNEVLREVDLDDFVSSQQYNTIHKIVLGITKLRLLDVLETSTADIDGGDIRGATPLWWAASQGNLAAVRILLENGASHAIGAGLSQTPLHVARDAEVVRLLLQHGAERDCRDTAGRTPLHCYCYRQIGASRSIVREILEAGSSANAVAYGGQTPLHYAATFGNTSLIPILLEYGADIDAVKDDGMTPLMAGVRHDQLDVVKALLEKEADCTTVNKIGQNILHLAATYAGDDCMTAVASSAGIGQVHRSVKDAMGYTPLEYFERRKFRDDDLDAAFLHLLQMAGQPNMDQDDEEADDDVNEYDGASSDEPQQQAEDFSMPGSFSAHE
ncbi:hypothetical protein ABEF95_011727 [Exophiala dermatitidis]